MQIPETFQLGGHVFTVVLDDELPSTRVMGECNTGTKKVRLASWMKDTQLEETYIHEIIESISLLHELNIDHSKICTLAVGIHQALTSGQGRLR